MAPNPNQERDNFLVNLTNYVCSHSLTAFYPPSCSKLQEIAEQSVQHVQNVHPRLISSPEIAQRLARLSLYDIVLLLDDSTSMRDEENGHRIAALRTFLQRIVSVTNHFDPDGISIRFLNHESKYDAVREEGRVDEILRGVQFYGWTKLGTEMWKKVAMPLVVKPAQENRLQKPVLVIIVTDGKPCGENRSALRDNILYTIKSLRGTAYDASAVAFQIARVGSDPGAITFLADLKGDQGIKDKISCISGNVHSLGQGELNGLTEPYRGGN
ncbi:hypothetical protein CC78DRAFT_330591 [Lojkania enalia]|uniref:VWFA domain-containing protein n=1 Tax=Lojkania enalia TaxID=147567 RepID=A0A9P4KID8_9PLEO|nr:hypothetical protein CC78DRAFT_330591 [Didymosphaeria enalia]